MLTLTSSNKVRLEWGTLPEASEYIIEKSLAGGAYVDITPPLKGLQSWEDELTSASVYAYRVRAESPSGAVFSSSLQTKKPWSSLIGGPRSDQFIAMATLPNEGSLLVGETLSFGSGQADAWIARCNSQGDVEWQAAVGGPYGDYANSVLPAADGGCVVVGQWGSPSSLGYDGGEAWIFKLGMDGKLAWELVVGGAGFDEACGIVEAKEGGYIVVGHTTSFGAGSYDIMILKISLAGEIQWTKTYGGPDFDGFSGFSARVLTTRDGNYVLAGTTGSFGAGIHDFLLMKFDGSGNPLWVKTYGGLGYDDCTGICIAPEGGFWIIGSTRGSFGNNTRNYWILRLTEEGGVVWERRYGEFGTRAIPLWVSGTQDGGAIIGGFASSPLRSNDLWIIRCNYEGEILWERAFGGDGDDQASGMGIRELNDGGFLVAARTGSLEEGQGWLFKVAADGTIDLESSNVSTRVTEALRTNTMACVSSVHLSLSSVSVVPAMSEAAITLEPETKK